MPSVDDFLSPGVLAVFGLCIGSFLNVVIHRLPLMLEREWRADASDVLGLPQAEEPEITLSRPRSRCPSCGHPISWYENIPVASWLWLRARCAACMTRISGRYPTVEIATSLLFAAIGWKFGAQPAAVLWCGFGAVLVAAALIDFDTQLLPDLLTVPLMWAGLIASALGWIRLPVTASIAGAVAGYLSLWTVAWLYRVVRGHEGMAHGDFKLLAALGAWLGWQMLPIVVLLSSVVGALVGVAMMIFRGHDRNVPIPFGPYLVGGGLTAMFFGETLMRLWMHR